MRLLTAYTLQATGAGHGFVLKMETAMGIERPTTWIPLGVFTTMMAGPYQDKQTFTDLLRYVRWNVTLTNISLAMFSLSGVGDRNPLYGSKRFEATMLNLLDAPEMM